MVAGVHQPRQSVQKPYADIQRTSRLDSSFYKILNEVDRHFKLLSRSHQVRIKQWTKKLKEQTNNLVWKKNRNAYARLLLDQLRGGVLCNPFDTTPPDGPLQTLPKWLIYRHSSPSKREAQGCDADGGETTERQGRSRASEGPRSLHGSSRRADSPFSSPRFGSPSLRATSPITQIRAERLGGASFRNLDKFVESSRDQTAELVWRMRRAESRLGAHEQISARERQRKDKYSRAELENIIERFEKRRASWTHVKDDCHAFQTSTLDRFYPGKSEGHFSGVRFALDQVERRTEALKAKLDLNDKRSQLSNTPFLRNVAQTNRSCEPKVRVFEERESQRYRDHVKFVDPVAESQMASAAAVASVALRTAVDDEESADDHGSECDSNEGESELLKALRAFKMKTEDLRRDILLSE